MSASAIGASERLWVHEELSNRPSNRIRESTLVIDAVTRALELGGEVHYVGSEERLDDLRTQLVLSGRALRMITYPLPEIGRIAHSASIALSDVIELGGTNLSILGVLCLPHRLNERVMTRPRGHPFLVVIDGVNGADRDAQLALAGISAFCHRQDVTLAMFP